MPQPAGVAREPDMTRGLMRAEVFPGSGRLRDIARRHNLHLALHGDVEAMIRRLREIRGLGFDGVWLGAPGTRSIRARALELLPRIKEL